MGSSINTKTKALINVLHSHHHEKTKKILVVGCGSGIEATVLAQHYDADVTGIDLEGKCDQVASKQATLLKMNAIALEFADDSFDLIYSYHALEHIFDPILAVKEINRVLSPTGRILIGTPNRARIIGQIGTTYGDWKKKVIYNIRDWKARLSDTFRNELGAHAGFSARELKTILSTYINSTQDVTHEYYLQLYKSHTNLIKVINASGLSTLVYPSVYFYGRNKV